MRREKKEKKKKEKMEFGSIRDFNQFILQKLKELMMALNNFWDYLVDEWNSRRPSDVKISEFFSWIKETGLPWLIRNRYQVLGGILIVCLLFWFLKRCCCCCCSERRVRYYRMMKTPGRDYRMRRDDFESDPRSYFQDLRGGDRGGCKRYVVTDDNIYLRHGLLDP